jgi:hypothetical protein
MQPIPSPKKLANKMRLLKYEIALTSEGINRMSESSRIIMSAETIEIARGCLRRMSR